MDAAHATGRIERLFIFLLCLLGAARVLIFSASFPFFSVAHEQAHLDLVMRYSHLELPRKLSHFSEEALPYVVYFSTAEYLWTPASQPGGEFAPPPWTLPQPEAMRRLAPREKYWRDTMMNHEASQPPLYYLLAGGWWRLGQALKLPDATQLLWLRVLNAPILAAVIWLAWATAKTVFPENRFMRMAVPTLAAFLPQSIFYAINNDVLAPLTFGAAFLFLLKFFEADEPSPGLAGMSGLALAAAFLTKTSNAPLIVAAVAVIAFKVFGLLRHGNSSAARFPLMILILTASLPVAAWMVWCKINFGDLTGSDIRVKYLGWTDKPFAEWFHHPIFSLSGAWYFVRGNLSTLWQGEDLWHGQPLAIPQVGEIYVVLTLGALALTLAALLRRPPQFTRPQCLALWFSWLCVVACFAFYALLSVKFDYHKCVNPSEALPFFVSGRLMLGMLVPFLLLFACGLDRLMSHFQNSTKYFVLLALAGFMITSEISTDTPVFLSQYNWIHM